MKRYLILILITVMCIIGIFTVGNIVTAASDVTVYTLQRQDADNTVTASGKLQYEDRLPVNAGNYCIVDEIMVKNGNTVASGDVLVKVSELILTEDFPYTESDAEAMLDLLNGNGIPAEIIDRIREYTVQKEIIAEKDGIISGICCKKDEILKKDTTIMTISDPSALVIPLDINEMKISGIQCGQSVRVNFPAIGDKKFSGEIIKISDEAKQAKSLSGSETTVETIVRIKDPDERLRIGYSAECIILVSTDKNILLLPYEYLHTDEKGSFVFVARGSQAYKVYIETGTEYRKGIAIKKGLRENEKIICKPDDLSDGQRIKITEDT